MSEREPEVTGDTNPARQPGQSENPSHYHLHRELEHDKQRGMRIKTLFSFLSLSTVLLTSNLARRPPCWWRWSLRHPPQHPSARDDRSVRCSQVQPLLQPGLRPSLHCPDCPHWRQDWHLLQAVSQGSKQNKTKTNKTILCISWYFPTMQKKLKFI